MRLLIFLYLLTCWIGTSSAFAETLYVKKSGTKMTSEPSGKSSTVALLNKDTAVESLGVSGKFIEVKSGSNKGWVFKFKLTNKAPQNSDEGGVLEGLLGKQEVSAAEASSSSSIRGLSPISEKHARDTGISEADILAVKQMEGVKASPAEVTQFLEVRKLGEFAN